MRLLKPTTNIPPLNFELIHKLEADLDKLLDEEEVYWRQRSRKSWFKWGDRNMSWFHRRASIRKKKNKVRGISDTKGNWVTNPEGIENIFSNYFQSIFTSTNPSVGILDRVLHCIPRRVTPGINSILSPLFCRMEILQAIKQIHPSKAQVLMDFQLSSTRNFWILLGITLLSNA